MAYAGALFADSCLRGLNGDSNVFDYSYVESDITDVPFFSSRVDLGPEGEHSLHMLQMSGNIFGGSCTLNAGNACTCLDVSLHSSCAVSNPTACHVFGTSVSPVQLALVQVVTVWCCNFVSCMLLH